MGGRVHAGAVIGRPHLEIAAPPAMIELDDPRLLEHVDRELLRVFDDTDEDDRPIVVVDGFADVRAVKRRVRSGMPLITPRPDDFDRG